MTKIKVSDFINIYGDREVDEMELAVMLKLAKPKTVNDLKPGDYFYYITYTGNVFGEKWSKEGIGDRRIREVGNAYLTREEAEMVVEGRKLEYQLQKMANRCEEPVDWSNPNQYKYYLIYNRETDDLNIGRTTVEQTRDIYFTDIEVLKEALREDFAYVLKKYVYRGKD